MRNHRLHLGLLVALVAVLLLGSRAGHAAAPPVVINEIMAGNAATNLDPVYVNYVPWLELHNSGAAAVNLGGYTVTEDPADPTGYALPAGTSIPAGGYLIIWMDELATGLHADFELDMRGGDVAMFMPDGTLVDSLTYDDQLVDVSYGRQPNGGGTWAYFDQPTPGANNGAAGLATPDQADGPVFSPPGGFYAAGQSVSLASGQGGVIRYTTDGSLPSATSPVYSAPIAVNAPRVIRARVFDAPGLLASRAATATYLIGFDTDLAVASLATDPKHLFDTKIGIYVVGTNGARGRCGPRYANWNQPWERPVSFEFFETDGSRAFQQDLGFEIQGDCTRAMPQKSLELKTRRRYGDNTLDYAIFPGNPLDEYRRLVLRGGGNHNAFLSMFREPLVHELNRETMDLDQQQYRPVVVFINGAYWGIQNLRDKADEALVEQNYGYDADDEFDMLREEGKAQQIDAGNAAAWQAFFADLQKDLTVPANYQAVLAQMDEDEFMDFFVAHTYSGNLPGGEFRFWKPYEPGAQWRWVFADLDNAFQRKQIRQNSLFSALKRSDLAIQPLKRMLTNPEFRAAFAQRMASHLNITYAPARVTALVNAMQGEIAAEMPRHISRWKKPRTMTVWENEARAMRDFAAQRAGVVRGHMNTYLGGPGLANLTIAVVESGQVSVAGVEPLAYPYTGPYFLNLPITLEAKPAFGYRFVEWQETGSTNPAITVTLTGALTRTAVFEAVPPPEITINEIHYNPYATQGDDAVYEFIELVNTGDQAVDLSGFSLTGVTFTFPDGATIAKDEIIVLAATAVTYAGLPVQVFQWTSGSLSNNSATVTLLDASGNVIDTVTYDDEAPWPTEPDGNSGSSLALLDLALDNSLAASWAASAEVGGTPGAVNFP